MKNKKNKKKLSLKKLQMTKIANPNTIYGGTKLYIENCENPENGSIIIDRGDGGTR